MDELDDIDFSRSINPLKLTTEQIDKLTTTVQDAKIAYDKKLDDLSSKSVTPLADDIHKRHKESVKGAAASKNFDDSVKSMMTDFYAKKEKLDGENLLAMVTACAKIITPAQQKIAAQLEKDTLVKLGRKLDPANTTDKYFNLYVLDVFISYRRIVPLLKDIKASSG